MLVCSGLPIQSKRGGSCPTRLFGLGSGVVSATTPNSEPLLGVEHAACIEFDDDAEHVIVLQQVGERLQRLQKPGKDERIGPQACVDPEHTVRGRCPLVVVDDNSAIPVRQGR